MNVIGNPRVDDSAVGSERSLYLSQTKRCICGPHCGRHNVSAFLTTDGFYDPYTLARVLVQGNPAMHIHGIKSHRMLSQVEEIPLASYSRKTSLAFSAAYTTYSKSIHVGLSRNTFSTVKFFASSFVKRCSSGIRAEVFPPGPTG